MFNNLLQYKRITEAIESISIKDHVCIFYESPEEQFESISPFIEKGFNENHFIVYISHENSISDVKEFLAKKIHSIEEEPFSKRIVYLTKHESYVKDGEFDPDRFLEFAKEFSQKIVNSGFKALRILGEMSWAVGNDPGSHRFLEYEAKVNVEIKKLDAIGLCQYNINAFSEKQLIEAIKVHPIVIYKGFVCDNPYYIPPNEYLNPQVPNIEVYRMLNNIWERQNDIKKLLLYMKKENEIEKEMIKLNKVETINSLASGIAHDFKNIFNIVMGNISIVQSSTDLTEENRLYLNKAFQAGNKALQILNHLFLINKSENIDLDVINPYDTVKNSIDFMTNLISLKTSYQINEKTNLIKIDLNQFEQVIQNIVLNANDAIECNNAFEIKFSNINMKTETLSDNNEKKYVKIEFKDYGKGIKDENLDQIFKPFFTTKQTGTGLGLFTSQFIINKFNGRIDIQSKENEGTSVILLLPTIENS